MNSYKNRYMDNIIEGVLHEWRLEAKLENPLMYNINWDNHHIIIYTTHPGILIGMRGKCIDKYKERMHEVWPLFEDFEIYEVWGCI